ncbi:MAG: SIR2 family protein [Verrucomicrobia bacterium]|nr:SIR2 family protein [Verrucomicrobiota bacterium]
MTPHQRLSEILHDHPSSPFLFVGSGFSQRYLGIPTWDGLLRMFCKAGAPYEFYLANADSKLPRCASLIAKDYADIWWKSDELAAIREKYKKHISTSSSPLKAAISEMLQSQYKIIRDPQLLDELAALRAFNAEGIITTNWDGLLEGLFPGYKVFIGQQSVVRQTPQNVAEIYKIHGCCTDPNSLVLTEEDYQLFREKQAYLAAKLITIFVEHPVVFIGYSISDTNILELLRSIINGLGAEEIKRLQRNLIFLQRSKPDRPAGVTETIIVVDGTPLPVTNLVSDDFLSIYSVLSQTKLKLPARLLRFCKEQLYEIVHLKEPSKRLCLVGIDDIKDKGEIEFVVGIGVAGSQVADRGYSGVSVRDLFSYVLSGAPILEANKIIEQTIPALDSGANFLPIFRFLREAGYASSEAIADESVKRCIAGGRESFKTNGYARAAARATSGRDFDWILKNLPPEKVAVFIPHLPDDRIDLDALGAFAYGHLDKAFSGTYPTFFRKLIWAWTYLAHIGLRTRGPPRVIP